MEVRYLAFVFLLLFFCSAARAAIGVSPAVYEINFRPGGEERITFDFRIDNPDDQLEVYVEGELKNYATLSTDVLRGDGNDKVEMFLKLPNELSEPGYHTLIVGGRQKAGKLSGFGIVANVRAVVKVFVPYPGKYAELEFEVKSANAGEAIPIKLKIESKGSEEISTSSHIEIYDADGKKVKTIELGSYWIEAGGAETITAVFDSQGYSPGIYKMAAVVDYEGKTALAEQEFRIGELFVEIVNYTSEVERKKINKFLIEVESFWGNQIENVFADVSVDDANINFQTVSKNLGGFSKAVLVGYIDASEIKNEEFQARIKVNYEGKSTEKVVTVKIKKLNYILIAVAVGIVLLLLVIAWILMSHVRKKRR